MAHLSKLLHHTWRRCIRNVGSLWLTDDTSYRMGIEIPSSSFGIYLSHILGISQPISPLEALNCPRPSTAYPASNSGLSWFWPQALSKLSDGFPKTIPALLALSMSAD